MIDFHPILRINMQPIVCISKAPGNFTPTTNFQAPVSPRLPPRTPCCLHFHPPHACSYRFPSSDHMSLSSLNNLQSMVHQTVKSFAKPAVPENEEVNLVPKIKDQRLSAHKLHISSQRLDKRESSHHPALYESDSFTPDMVALGSTKESIFLRRCMPYLTSLKSMVLWPLLKPPDAGNDSSHQIKPSYALPNSENNESIASKRDHGDIKASRSLAMDSKTLLEVPYRSVLHSKESFSKFLHAASLFQMKCFAQLAFLCDMAYVIPELKPRHLFRYHQLKIVTSSLDKKAQLAITTQIYINSHVGNGATGSNSKEEDEDLHHKGNKSTTAQAAQASDSIESLMDKEPASQIDKDGKNLFVSKDSQRSLSSCPCEWFVCDEESSCTRFLVVQGSDSIASWQTNFHFQPTSFEGLDVLVHSGIYEAATALYEQVLPEVLAHFSMHGKEARLRFTGHSLGGSLATLLALMFQIRGVLPSTSILPVISFGSPSIIYGGNNLLQRMKLPHDHVQSVIMHRDIVPRLFSSNYPDYLTRVLKRLIGGFREHPCLSDQKLLYAPVGQIFILQPDETTSPSHPLLPDGYGLYILKHPAGDENVEHATELRAAQRAFLNMPHPFEILKDTSAYGSDGTILRNHNTVNYTKAIHLVMRKEIKRHRQIQRHQRRQEWCKLT